MTQLRLRGEMTAQPLTGTVGIQIQEGPAPWMDTSQLIQSLSSLPHDLLPLFFFSFNFILLLNSIQFTFK